MRWQAKLLVGFVVAVVAVSVQAQERKFLVSPTQVVAIRAGRLFDAKSGNMVNNQVVPSRATELRMWAPCRSRPRRESSTSLRSR